MSNLSHFNPIALAMSETSVSDKSLLRENSLFEIYRENRIHFIIAWRQFLHENHTWHFTCLCILTECFLKAFNRFTSQSHLKSVFLENVKKVIFFAILSIIY